MAGVLATIIRLNSPALQGHLDRAAINLDAPKMLLALVGCESTFGRDSKPRHEKSYDIGGKWHNPALYKLYGDLSCMSYSSFQMMHPVAFELGYDEHPVELDVSRGGNWVVCPLVIEYWRLRVIEKGHKSLEDFADAYNSGSVGGFIPTDYIKKFVDYYGQSAKWLESQIV